jgi:hypothetical protein
MFRRHSIFASSSSSSVIIISSSPLTKSAIRHQGQKWSSVRGSPLSRSGAASSGRPAPTGGGGIESFTSFRDPKALFGSRRNEGVGGGSARGGNIPNKTKEYEFTQEFMDRMRDEAARRKAIPNRVDFMPRTGKGSGSNTTPLR